MRLVARIEYALRNNAIDPHEFERCATYLLQSIYPGLSAVSKGHDFGRDADIYFPIQGADDVERRGRLCATAMENVRANVKAGLASMKKAGLRVDLLVVATTRPLTARRRLSIEKLAKEEADIDNCAFFTEEWFVRALAEDPEWRVRLLDVSGDLEGLVELPLHVLDDPRPKVVLLGREAEQREIESLIASGDLVLSGVPGVGKTRLLSALSSGVLFVEPASPERIVDDLRLERPRAVVVDDAHDRLQIVELLRRARTQESLDFKIVATAHPSELPKVLAALPQAGVHELAPLERTLIDQIISHAGVSNYYARAYIIDQARGRPGWALTLVSTLVGGDGKDLVTGRTLLRQVESFLRRTARADAMLDAIAHIALFDSMADSDLVTLSNVVGVPHAELVQGLRDAAKNGLLDRAQAGWRLQPSLRPPLVARWFFSDDRTREWSGVADSFTAREDQLLSALFLAAGTGEGGALLEADRWARGLPSVREWGLSTWGQVGHYASLSEMRSDWVLERCIDALQVDREPVTYGGRSWDPVGAAVQSAIVGIARSRCTARAIATLLDLAVGDTRPRHSTTEHPLRVVADLAKGVSPRGEIHWEARLTIVQVAAEWILRNNPKDSAVGAEALAAALSSEASGSWVDHADPMKIQLIRTTLPRNLASKLVAPFEQTVVPLLTGATLGQRLSVEAVSQLMDCAQGWLRPEPVSSDAAETDGGFDGALLLSALSGLASDSPGLSLRFNRILERYGVTSLQRLPVDRDLAAFVRDESAWDAEDLEAALGVAESGMDALATRISALSPDAAVARVEELLSQARAVRSGYEYQAWELALKVVEKLDPEGAASLLDSAFRVRSIPMADAALRRRIREDEAGPWLTAAQADIAFGDQGLRQTLVSAVLRHGVTNALVTRVIEDLGPRDARLVHEVVERRDQVDQVVEALLLHPLQSIAEAAALGFRVIATHGPPLPDELRSRWNEVVANIDIESGDQHTEYEVHRLVSGLVSVDPDLVETWVRRQMTSNPLFAVMDLPYDWGAVISGLPKVHRARLARSFGKSRTIGPSFLPALLADDDAALAQELLDEDAITLEDLLDAVSGNRGALLEAIAPLLVRGGIAIERIAWSGNFDSGWNGERSDTHRRRREDYEALLSSSSDEVRSIAAAGIQIQRELEQAALGEEKLKRVRGER